jgi:uncharacterized protein (DUF2235 family)
MANQKITECRPRNIIILSDGTGQRGGLYVDETRSNIYKLYRAARVAPDSTIDPGRQAAFYDPGLGTLQPGGTSIERAFRWLYNFVSQATGLGITRNIIDCYAAIVQLWRPGDRIFLFGFSRGAYTVRCLASVICYCGIPTSEQDGKPLRRDLGNARRVATRAVKSVYQHVSSPRDAKYTLQRRQLAVQFRADYRSNHAGTTDTPNAFPFFIGVFDTVASLSNTGSLVVLCLMYAALHLGLAGTLSLLLAPFSFWYWFGWLAIGAFGLVIAAYVYTHLKFSFSLRQHFFWDVIHLTTFRQRFYDQYLRPEILYARHAISIDERRNDFQRVPWGARQTDYWKAERKVDSFEQVWFAGNHADIGGGYPENESRLSDISLQWMIDQATDARLGDDALLVDRAVLKPSGRADGMQHDETQSSVFRWVKKTLREPLPQAPLHASVLERFELNEIQQYDIMAPYRPEALRTHDRLTGYYADVPLPRVTGWQWFQLYRKSFRVALARRLDAICGAMLSRIYPSDWTPEPPMDDNKRILTPDSIVSLIGLLALVAVAGLGAWIWLFWQIVPWLREGVWHSYPVATFFHPRTNWIGLQFITNWLVALPVTFVLAIFGVALFWGFGLISTKMYQCASRDARRARTDESLIG